MSSSEAAGTNWEGSGLCGGGSRRNAYDALSPHCTLEFSHEPYLVGVVGVQGVRYYYYGSVGYIIGVL
jgi:hypothetical protein